MPDPAATAKARAILGRLRDARARAGLSYQQLADKHGGTAVTIRSHEVGDRAFTLPGLIEHARWFGLEVVVRPAGDGPGQAGDWKAGYDQAVVDACAAWGVRTDDDGSGVAS